MRSDASSDVYHDKASERGAAAAHHGLKSGMAGRITRGPSYVTACVAYSDKDGAIRIPLSVLLVYAWLSVSSPRGICPPGTTSYVTTCQNWRSSNSRRHSPVQSTLEEHPSMPFNQNSNLLALQITSPSNHPWVWVVTAMKCRAVICRVGHGINTPKARLA